MASSVPTDLDQLAARAADDVSALQQRICTALEDIDGVGRFRFDLWERPGGGGGRSGVLAEGAVFEKAGVNISTVFGELEEEFAKSLPGDGLHFYATGISLVLHPRSPMVPATHANFRFLRRGNVAWFGGGADLTPYYPFHEDAVHFHRTLKEACDRHGADLYPRFKAWCDEYFFLKHRGETRGVGGIFFDYLQDDLPRTYAFWRDVGEAFLPAYVPIVQRRRNLPYGERERRFQLYRRGRYVEFNLLYDRGTVFGLRTAGRVESILMSLPPLVRWDYGYVPEPGSREAELMDFLRPRDWLAEAAQGAQGA
ncbi:MAG: oxygen-dependent coproporphyrinogen oxidase [Myxococcales bacterium]|nr:oxygen-dependent coproporphyrinogen oxidase [Myxococcales bacterium]